MGIETGDENARTRDAKFALQVVFEHDQHARELRCIDAARHVSQCKMGGCQCHAHHRLAAGEQHHHLRRRGLPGEIFGVAGEGDAGVVDHALVHRRGDHGGELARHAAGQRSIEGRQHVS